MMTTADWIIDLGPEGGGQIVATGTAEEIVSDKELYRVVFEAGAGPEFTGAREEGEAG